VLRELRVPTRGKGLVDITSWVEEVVREAAAKEGAKEGLCTVMVRHTSASLLIQENADPSARHDLERFFERLVPEGDPLYTHTAEGPDDMPSHVRAALTATTLSIPIAGGRLGLGTWQGIYLFEHRTAGNMRRVWVQVMPG
jgi:secondary thiamine-phosphate synthase enzyme